MPPSSVARSRGWPEQGAWAPVRLVEFSKLVGSIRLPTLDARRLFGTASALLRASWVVEASSRPTSGGALATMSIRRRRAGRREVAPRRVAGRSRGVLGPHRNCRSHPAVSGSKALPLGRGGERSLARGPPNLMSEQIPRVPSVPAGGRKGPEEGLLAGGRCSGSWKPWPFTRWSVEAILVSRWSLAGG